MLFVELQRVNHADQLVHVTSQRQIVDHLMAHQPSLVDQEGAAIGHRGACMLNIIGLADGMADVGDHGVTHRANAALVHRGIAPGRMGEL